MFGAYPVLARKIEMTEELRLAVIKQEGTTIDYGEPDGSEPEKTSWMELIELEAIRNGDGVGALRINGDTRARFNNGYGGVYKASWTVWTETHVYVPSIFDGKPSVVSVPRNPSDFVYTIDEMGV